MLVLEMEIRTDSDREPVPTFMAQILTKKIMHWLHKQGIEGDLTVREHKARLCIMTDGWKDDDYEPFVERLRIGVKEALQVQ